MQRLNPPIRYFGGKTRYVHKLLELIPHHRTYVEVFGGSGALLFAKPPSEIEVYNDVWLAVSNLYAVLRSEEHFQEFVKKVHLTLFSRYETLKSIEKIRFQKPDIPDVDHAVAMFTAARQCFGGIFMKENSWSFMVSKATRGVPDNVASWLSAVDKLPAIHQRLRHVQIEWSDFRTVLKNYDTPDTFFYLDPPYVQEARGKDKLMYPEDMELDDHEALVDMLLKIKGKALLSGYDHPVYKPLEDAGWRKKQFDTVAYSAGASFILKGTYEGKDSFKRTETLWFNYEPEGFQLSLI